MSPKRRAIMIVVLLIGFDACVVSGGVNAAPGADSTGLLAQATPAATAAATPGGDLGPTSDPPWNPPQAMGRRRLWEQALTLPGRIVTLPLSGLGYVTDKGLLLMEETAFIARANYIATVVPERTG